MLEKFRKGAEKAGIQATAFLNNTGSKVASESRRFAQEFTLPGEAEKAAKILSSFLGERIVGLIELYGLKCLNWIGLASHGRSGS